MNWRTLGLGVLLAVGLPSSLGACGDQKLVAEPNVPPQLGQGNGGDVPPANTSGSTSGATRASAGSTTGRRASTSAGTGAGSTSGSGSTSSSSATGTTSGGSTTTTTTGGCPDVGPDLTGDWTMTSTYNLQQAGLPTLNAAITDINTALNLLNSTGILAVPPWLLDLFGVLTSFDVVFNQLNVTSTLALAPVPGAAGSYTATETWTVINAIDPSGNPISLTAGQVTLNSPDPYGVSVCMPSASYANHAVGGALAGLVTPLLDAVVSLSSGQNGAPQFNTFADLLDYMFTNLCSSIPSFTGQLACSGYLSSSLQSEINGAIASIAASLSVAEVQGTATVQSSALQDTGVWQGSDGAGSFDGSFSCTRP